MTEHVCRFCLARVLQRGQLFVCSTCSASTEAEPVGICGCGMHLGPRPRSAREASRMKLRTPKGFHCGRNPTVADTSPALHVIFYLDSPLDALAASA